MHRSAVRAALASLAMAVLVLSASAQPRPSDLQAPALVAMEALERGETPVRLQAAEIDVEISGSLARTTLLLTLYNPNDRVLEGTLQFPLQPSQQVAGFALDVDGAMRDAVPVPKAKGQQVFESIERRGVDPGLLEQTAGNHFRLRVYPLPPRGTRRVKLVLDEAMRREDGRWKLDLPTAMLRPLDAFALRVHGAAAPPEIVGSFDPLQFAREVRVYSTRVPVRALQANTPLALRFATRAEPSVVTSSHEGERYALVEIPLASPGRAALRREIPRHVGVLWDASASARRRGREGEFALLDRYFRAMGDGTVSLRLLRDVGEDGGRFEVRGGDWSALRRRLEGAVADGATNLSDWRPANDIGEYLLVSDGLQNYGGAMPALRPNQRLYALDSAGADSDAQRLSAWAERTGGRLVSWSGRQGLEAAADALLRDGIRITGLRGEGIDDLQTPGRHPEGGVLRIAGRLTERAAVLHVTLSDVAGNRTLHIPLSADAPQASQAAQLWARWRAAELSAEPDLHRATITRLGQQFALVTPGTSLLVLEDPADYVRHEIPAPVELRAEVARLQKEFHRDRERSRREHLDDVAALFEERIAWWQRKFPKDAPPHVEPVAVGPAEQADAVAAAAELAEADASAAAERDPSPRRSLAAPPPAPSVPLAVLAPSPAAQEATTLDRIEVTGSRIDQATLQQMAAGPSAVIRLAPWQPDSAYARRLRAARPEEIYAMYLDERDSHRDSTAFYLDVADLLFQRGRRAEALRVLSNLAELELENRHVLRVLGYRLMQAQAWPEAVRVFRQVLELADEEPQSHRDLGLALAAAGERQEAVERLYEVVAREWDARFAEVELIALNELNAIVATSPTPLDTSSMDARLLRNLPLDLRVVLGWDSDNSDMDLWVTDPDGEKGFYGNRLTRQGGLMSDDFTGGYGPEEFLLRHAKPGTYRVEANFFGDRQQIVTGATGLTLTFSTGWGMRAQRDRTVTLRLSEGEGTVFVGEFEVH